MRQLGGGNGSGQSHPAADGVEELRAGALARAPESVAQDRATGCAQLLQPGLPRHGFRRGQQHQGEQQIVQLVGRPQIRGGLRDHLRDGCGIERSQRRGIAGIERAPELHRPRSPLLQRGVVEIRVRRRVQDLVRERRRLRRVAREQSQLAALHPLQQPAQTFDVHRLVEAVAQRLPDQGVIGGLDHAGIVLLALRLRGEDLREQVVGAHAEDVEGDLLAGARPQHRERTRRVPAPANSPHRRAERRLREDLVDGAGSEELEDGLQRETVLRSHREQDPLVGRRGLELEVEGPAEALAQRQPEGAVLLRPERRVHDQLHAAGLVEEPLRDQRALGRKRSQGCAGRAQIPDDLFRACLRNGAVANEEFFGAGRLVEERLDLLAQPRHFLRQLGSAPRRLAVPERQRRRRAVRVLHPHPPRLDPPDLPALVAEQEDVAGHALDGPVLIDLADGDSLGLRHHRVLRRVRDRSAAGERRDARAAPRLDHVMDAVAMQPGALGAARSPRDTLGVHLDQRIEFGPWKRAVWPGSPDQRVRVVLREILARRHRHELLGEHVEGPLRNRGFLEIAAADPAHQRGALDELVARRRKQAPLGYTRAMVRGAADALHRDGEAARRLELHHQVDGADVDSELERGRRNRAADVAALEFFLRRQPHRPRHAAVMRNDLVLAQALGKLMRHPLDVPARVDEDQRRPVLANELRDAIAGLVPLLLGSDSVQLVARHFDVDVERPPRAALHDGAGGPAREEASDLLDGFLGRGESDPHALAPT